MTLSLEDLLAAQSSIFLKSVRHLLSFTSLQSFGIALLAFLKNVYLVLINSLRYRKKVSTREIFLSLIDNLKSLQSKSYFSSKSLTKFFSALLIQQVCKLVKGFWKKIRKQFYGLMVCQSTWEWKKVFLKMELGIPEEAFCSLCTCLECSVPRLIFLQATEFSGYKAKEPKKRS